MLVISHILLQDRRPALTDWTEVTHEECLFPVVNNLAHEPISQEDRGYPPEGQYHEAQKEELSNRDACNIWHVKLLKWQDGSDVHETAKVEQHIDAAVHFVVPRFGFFKEPSVPVHDASGNKTGQQVVTAEKSAHANNE